MIDPAVMKILEEMKATLADIKAAVAKPAGAGASEYPPLTDADLDDPNHDREIKYPPKKWDGPDYTGRRMSQIPDPAFLRCFADLCDWKARKDAASTDPEVQKKARWNRLDAQRARLFAARAESRPAAEPVTEELPF